MSQGKRPIPSHGSNFCKDCENMASQYIYSADGDRLWTQSVFKQSYWDLSNSAADGCLTCDYFLEHASKDVFLKRPNDEIWVGRTRPQGKDYERDCSRQYLLLSLSKMRLAQSSFWNSSRPVYLEGKVLEVELLTKAIQPSKSYDLNKRLIDRSDDLFECGEYIVGQLRECRENHPKCADGRTQRLPRRLLELMLDRPSSTGEQTYMVRVVDSSSLSEVPDYVALSHCWGPPNSGQTRVTPINFEEFQSGVPISQLAPLLQDAAQMSFFLGFRFLWVDSLCIIQDSIGDWQVESSYMADCYRNAALTICASSSSTSSHHLVPGAPVRAVNFASLPKTDDKPRMTAVHSTEQKLDLTYCPLPPPAGSSQSQIFIAKAGESFSLYGTGRDPTWAVDPDRTLKSHFSEPLERRGWCVQERALSPRKIFFRPKQLYWECRTIKNFELWTKDLKDIVNPGVRSRYASRIESPLFSISSGVETSDLYEWWYDLLNDYGGKNFTFETDLLPGLAGIAQTFMDFTNDKYLAGIWQADLFRGLTWRLQPSSNDFRGLFDLKSNDSTNPTQPRSIQESFAPSWSWASVWGDRRSLLRGQSYFGDALFTHYMSYDARTTSNKKIYKRLPLEPRLLDVRIESVTPDTAITGQLKQAELQIEAPCTLVVPNIINHLHDLEIRLEIPGISPKWLNQYLYAHVDYPLRFFGQSIENRTEGRPFELECALMGYTSGLHCLLLQKIENSDVDGAVSRYRRVGVVNIEYQPEKFLDCWKMKTLILE